ncbi:hypothetical protein, partial [Paraburkholderia sp. UYCP14C]|uniref:hypothetical protein n=1 Tax=Paraburkholderia sp. UYCP14C TaxID=2511130 RepID=UPI001B7D6BF3
RQLRKPFPVGLADKFGPFGKPAISCLKPNARLFWAWSSVEVHKDEIVVVFRVDPQPPLRSSENPNESGEGGKSMQHCRRRNYADP